MHAGFPTKNKTCIAFRPGRAAAVSIMTATAAVMTFIPKPCVGAPAPTAVFRTEVTFRTEAGFRTDAGEAVIEAEEYGRLGGTRGGAWKPSTEKTGFAGSGYMQAGAAVFSGAFDTALTRMEYAIDFRETGTWYLHVRHWAADHADNSLLASLDGKSISPSNKITLSLDFPKAWRWRTAEGSGKDNPSPAPSFRIDKAGTHVLALVNRETGARIDRFWLTKARKTAWEGKDPALRDASVFRLLASTGMGRSNSAPSLQGVQLPALTPVAAGASRPAPYALASRDMAGRLLRGTHGHFTGMRIFFQ